MRSTVALLVERPVMLNLHAAVRSTGDDSLDFSPGKVGAETMGSKLIGKQHELDSIGSPLPNINHRGGRRFAPLARTSSSRNSTIDCMKISVQRRR